MSTSLIRRAARFVRMAAAACLAAASIAPAEAGEPVKVALVVANAKYDAVSQLFNTVNDARLIASSLKSIGFSNVVVAENLGKVAMEKALRDFSLVADKADVAVIYYAGHGMEMNGANYLIPVDARLARDRDVDVEAVKMSTLLDMAEGAKQLRVIILDACRNNPFEASMVRANGSRSVSRGLAAVQVTGQSLVVYATKAGTTAADGTGQNSPFARALAARIGEPREINMLFRRVRDDVLKETGGEQEPFTYGSLSSDEFYFRAPTLSVAAGAAPAAVDIEAEAWGLCRGAHGRGPCDAYLASYGKGRFAALAKAKLSDFGTAAPIAVTAAAPMRAELVQALGVNVRGSDDGAGIAVQGVQPSGLAFGQLFAGDVITAINSAALQPGRSAGEQLTEGMASGRIRLLVKRGPTSTLVILRQ